MGPQDPGLQGLWALGDAMGLPPDGHFIPGINGNAALPAPLTPECRAMGSPQESPWCTYKDVSNCRGGAKRGPAYRCVRVLVP